MNPNGHAANLKNAGKGRPKGSKNKNTDLKQAVLYTFNRLGGEKAMFKWVQEKPKNKEIFYGQILVKVLPKDVNLGGDLFSNIGERMLEARKLREELEAKSKLEHRPVLEISPEGKLIAGTIATGSIIEHVESEKSEDGH